MNNLTIHYQPGFSTLNSALWKLSHEANCFVIGIAALLPFPSGERQSLANVYSMETGIVALGCDPGKIGLIQTCVWYKRKNLQFTHTEDDAERKGSWFWTWICRAHSVWGPCLYSGFKRSPRLLFSSVRCPLLCTVHLGSSPMRTVGGFSLQVAHREHRADGKRTWAHTCTESPGAGKNKDNFLNRLLIQGSLHISQCCSSPQLTWKTCSQTHLSLVICLGERKKERRKERKKDNNWRY